jgi:hypothetical protein
MAVKTKAELEAELEQAKAQLNNNLSPMEAIRNLIDAVVINTRTVKEVSLAAQNIGRISTNAVEGMFVWGDTYVRNEIAQISNQSKL